MHTTARPLTPVSLRLLLVPRSRKYVNVYLHVRKQSSFSSC